MSRRRLFVAHLTVFGSFILPALSSVTFSEPWIVCYSCLSGAEHSLSFFLGFWLDMGFCVKRVFKVLFLTLCVGKNQGDRKVPWAVGGGE